MYSSQTLNIYEHAGILSFCDHQDVTLGSDFSVVNLISENVGNKAKGRISKRVFQENKARQIFRITNI